VSVRGGARTDGSMLATSGTAAVGSTRIDVTSCSSSGAVTRHPLFVEAASSNGAELQSEQFELRVVLLFVAASQQHEAELTARAGRHSQLLVDSYAKACPDTSKSPVSKRIHSPR
jgi:hypothetical protein